MDIFGQIGRMFARFQAQPLLNAIEKVFGTGEDNLHPIATPEAIIYPYTVPDFSELLANALTDENKNANSVDILTRLKSTIIVEECQVDMPVAEINRVSATKGYSGRIESSNDFIDYLTKTAESKKAAGQTFTPIEWNSHADYQKNIDHLIRNTGIDYRVELYSGAYITTPAKHTSIPRSPFITLSNDGGGHHGLAAFFQARQDRITDTLAGKLRAVYLHPDHCLNLCDQYHILLVPTGPFFRVIVESRVNQPGFINLNCAHQQAPVPWEGHTVVYLPKHDTMATTTATALLAKGERFGILDLGAEWQRILQIQCCPAYLWDKLSLRFRTCDIPTHQQHCDMNILN